MIPRLLLLVLLITAQAVAVGDDWLLSQPVPTSMTIQAVAHDGAKFIAVGQHGATLGSPDGTAWERKTSELRGDVLGIVWTGTQFVAVGMVGSIATSLDGDAWTLRTSPVRLAWRAVTWDGTRLIAVGDAGAIATSLNGSTWSLTRPGVVRDLHGVAAGGGLIVAVGEQGALLTSANASTWTSITPVTPQKLRAVARSGSRWVAVGDGGVLITSTNGSAWSVGSSGVTKGLRGVHWSGAQFVAVGDDGVAITSPDGLTWTAQSTGQTAAFQAVCAGAGTIVIAGETGCVATSTNAVAWTTRSSGSIAALKDVTHDGGQFIAVGALGVIRTSVDAVSWTTRTSGTTETLHGVSATATRRVVVGNAGTILSSADGITWGAHSTAVTTALRGVVRTSTAFVAVGRSGRVVTSANGTAWAAQNLGANVHLLAVAWSGSLLVAVGEGGIIRTSSNGTAWTAQTSGVSTALESVAWNGSRFMAVGADGVVLTSADGVAWTQRSSPTAELPDFAYLRVVRAIGSSFVLAGSWGLGAQPRAFVAETLDGTVWVPRTVGAAPGLEALASASGTTVAVGESGTILRNPVGILPSVQVQQLSSSVSESVGSTQVSVVLSAVSASTVLVPLSLSGTATVGAAEDVTLSANDIAVPAGDLSASVVITVRDDVVDESDEILQITLGSPLGATLGLNVTHDLTILDNDAPPVVTLDPVGQIVTVGTAVTLTAAVAGDAPLSYQWKKGTTLINGATTFSFSIAAAALTHAGDYQLTATNAVGSVNTAVAALAVVDATPKTVSLLEGQTTSFTVSAAGTGLSFQWYREDVPVVNDAHYSDATTSKLVLANVTGAHAGQYRCRVTSGLNQVFAGVITVGVSVKPFVITPVLGTVRVSEFMEIAVFAGNTPTSYTITGLPSGLTYDKTTGVISGRPLVASGALPFTIRIKATNSAGSSPEVTASLTVLPLATGTTGSYLGTVDREDLINSNSFMGGTMSLAIAATGKITGSLKLGSATHAFLPVLDTSPVSDPSCFATIARTGLPSLTVAFQLNPASGLITGTLTDGSHTTVFRAWRAMAAPFTGYTGYHTCALKLVTPGDVGDTSVPQAYGYATFTVGATGTASGTIRLADGVNATLSTPLRYDGGLVVFAPLYGNTGSLLGTLNLVGGLVSTAGLDWSKAQQPLSSTTRSYKDGFGPVSLLVTGALYTTPPAILMGLSATADDVPNAALTFTEGGAPDPANRLNVELRYSAPNVRDPQTPTPNPGRVSITTATGNGLFSGSFTLSDMDTSVLPNVQRTRVTAYDGVIARDVDAVLRGFGRFQLSKMPDNLLFPVTTLKTSPMLSGRVLLAPLP